MRADSAISLTRLRPTGGQAMAKPRHKTWIFDLISFKLKHLHVMSANLSALGQRCDEPGAKWRHRRSQPKRLAAASGFFAAAGWQTATSRCRPMPYNCGKYSAEKPHAGNLSFGTRGNCAMCLRRRQIAQLCE
jgi:hypothetical protein